jgi:hypothetical protein
MFVSSDINYFGSKNLKERHHKVYTGIDGLETLSMPRNFVLYILRACVAVFTAEFATINLCRRCESKKSVLERYVHNRLFMLPLR